MYPFHSAKFQKKSHSRSSLMMMRHFWAQNGPFAPNKNIFGKYYYHFHHPIDPFHCAKFEKNSHSRSRLMIMHHFWAQNGQFAQTRIFSENLLISICPFIHAYLHAKNQSQILIY